MKIKQLRIRNYKSWNDSGLIKLDVGLNIIVGQNDAGKTALLEALSLRKGSNPHTTIISKPESDSYIDGNSIVDVTFQFDQNELFRATLTLNENFFVPLPGDNHPVATAIEVIIGKLKEAQEIAVEVRNSQIVRAEFESPWYSTSRKYIQSRVNNTKSSIELHSPEITHENNSGHNRLSTMLIEALRSRIYFLRAERYNIGQAQVQHSQELLEQNSNNLAQVLHSLQSSNPERFNRVIDLLKKVFPRIKAVTAPVKGGQAQIVIWSVDPKSERKDLAVPLSESGTGVGQVLAMLYLIIYSDVSQCILIDEPQSFLHPGAFRSLLEILYAHSRHQYIITTHSPHILSIPSSTIIHVIHDGNESRAEVIDGLKANEARLILQDIGFKLSDVFGADRILWVEGPTEEECFKLIVRTFRQETLWGIEILGVRSTGELHGKHAETAYDIYTKLSNGMGIIPPAVGFIFDRELRSEKEMVDLKRKSKNKVFFLPRRMFENYLLEPGAISTALNLISGSKKFHPPEIESWLKANGVDRKYLKEGAPFDQCWLNSVDGASILKDLFSQISDTRINYDKVKHGYLLTKIILEKNRQAFLEIHNLLDEASSVIKVT
jgi:predicted ATPase